MLKEKKKNGFSEKERQEKGESIQKGESKRKKLGGPNDDRKRLA